MTAWFLRSEFAGLWTLVWHFGAATGLMICCLVFAWFSPVFKKTALWAALAIFIGTGIYATGVLNGEARVHAQWLAAEKHWLETAEDARTNAEHDVSKPDRVWPFPDRVPDYESDPYNRDRP